MAIMRIRDEDGNIYEVPVVKGDKGDPGYTPQKAAVALWDTAENNPDNAPSLWENIEYKDGYRIIPDTLTVTTAFAKGECGWWNDVLYRSLMDGNVYTPAVYPQGWEKV